MFVLYMDIYAHRKYIGITMLVVSMLLHVYLIQISNITWRSSAHTNTGELLRIYIKFYLLELFVKGTFVKA